MMNAEKSKEENNLENLKEFLKNYHPESIQSTSDKNFLSYDYEDMNKISSIDFYNIEVEDDNLVAIIQAYLILCENLKEINLEASDYEFLETSTSKLQIKEGLIVKIKDLEIKKMQLKESSIFFNNNYLEARTNYLEARKSKLESNMNEIKRELPKLKEEIRELSDIKRLSSMDNSKLLDKLFSYLQHKLEVSSDSSNGVKLIFTIDNHKDNFKKIERMFNQNELVESKEDVSKELMLKSAIKIWVKDNISSNPKIIDIIVNGSNTYYSNFSRDKNSITYSLMSDFSIRHNNGINSSFLKDKGDSITFAGNDFIELKNAYINVMDKLLINGFPLGKMDIGLQKSILEKNIYIYEKIYSSNELNEIAMKSYKTSKIKEEKSFFKSILKKDYLMKRDSNPLLEERESELELFYYNVSGECYKSDGYSSWSSDIDHYFISNKKLDLYKLSELYENEYDYEIERIINLNTTEIEKRDCILYSNEKTFIEIGKDNKYITRPYEYRFRYLEKKEETANVETCNNIDLV